MKIIRLKNFLNKIKDTPEHFEPGLIDATMSGWFKQETSELIEGFKISSEDVILDVGCGDGPFIPFCAKHGAQVIFADIDKEKVSEMSKRLETDNTMRLPLVCDACALPLRDSIVTKIICTEILEHVDDTKALLKELVRVGKDGAQYLISVPDPILERLQKDIAQPFYFEKPHHIRIIDREDFEKMVIDAGLTIEERKLFGFYKSIWWLFWWMCKQDAHPLLESWTKTWGIMLNTPDGPKLKKILDEFLPKSQVIIARKLSVVDTPSRPE